MLKRACSSSPVIILLKMSRRHIHRGANYGGREVNEFEHAYDCVHFQYRYTVQHRTVPIVFRLVLQAVVTASVMSAGGFNEHCARLTLRLPGVCWWIVKLHVVTLTARLLSVDGKEPDSAGGDKYVDMMAVMCCDSGRRNGQCVYVSACVCAWLSSLVVLHGVNNQLTHVLVCLGNG